MLVLVLEGNEHDREVSEEQFWFYRDRVVGSGNGLRDHWHTVMKAATNRTNLNFKSYIFRYVIFNIFQFGILYKFVVLKIQ